MTFNRNKCTGLLVGLIAVGATAALIIDYVRRQQALNSATPPQPRPGLFRQNGYYLHPEDEQCAREQEHLRLSID